MTDIRATTSNNERKKRGEYIKRPFLKAPLPIDMSAVPIGATDVHYLCHMSKPEDTLEGMRASTRHCTACVQDCNLAYFYNDKYNRCIPCTLADMRAKKKDNHHSSPTVDSGNVNVNDAIKALTHAISVLALQKERLEQQHTP